MQFGVMIPWSLDMVDISLDFGSFRVVKPHQPVVLHVSLTLYISHVYFNILPIPLFLL